MARRRAAETPPSRPQTVLKWVGSATAVLSLVFAIVQLVRLTSETRDRRRQVEELLRTEALQRQAADYAGAWASLERALSVAESGGQLAKLTGQLGSDARRVRIAQEDLAMIWLQDLRAAAGSKYTPIVDAMAPVMSRGASQASGARKADLLAHIAWGTFYKSLDGLSIPDLTAQYRAALAEDPANPFAHAFLGHWIVWSGGTLPAAMSEFAAAVSANRARPVVRRVQRWAMRRAGQRADAAIVSVINEMRVNGEPVDDGLRNDAESVFSFACGSRENPEMMRDLLAAVAPADLLATYRALFAVDAANTDDVRRRTRRACLATLLESAGRLDEAAQAWRELRDSIPPGQGSIIRDRADASLKRLGAKEYAPR